MKITEENIAEAVRKGDEKAIRFIIDRYGGLLAAIIKRHLPHDHHDYEECLDDVLLAAWQHIDSYDPSQNSFKQWLAAIAKYKAIDYRRKRSGGLVAAVLLATGVTLGAGGLTVANVPVLSGLIETYLQGEEQSADFSSYKTAIGQTAENEYGRITLNEVLIDGGRLVISASFEPADGVEFHHRMHPMPTILMDGQKVEGDMAGQSIEVNHALFTLYNEVTIPHLPLGEEVHFQIIYDNLDYELGEAVPVENPWVFELRVPTEQVAAQSDTIVLQRPLPLAGGHTLYVKKLVVTPISTVIYYDWPEGADHIGFKIVSQSGEEIWPDTMAISGVDSYNRYETTLHLEKEKYYLVPFLSAPNSETQDSGSVPDEAIPIN